jgi:hypothetical protein
MTTDEKIDRMSDRIDALTQSVELLASMHKDTEVHVVKMTDAITRLANIAAAHDQRIEDLEDRQ